MEVSEIERILTTSEDAVARAGPVGPEGFWRAVAAVKSDPTLVEKYANRVAAIDSQAFQNWALVTVPMSLGNVLMIGGTVVGFALIWWSYNLAELGAGLVFLLGFGIILVTTHGLGHLIVGGLMGMRFTHWFIGSVRFPQPGVKLDYSTYLRAPARSRAWMHASGAIVTKLAPWLLLGGAIAADLPIWAIAVVIAVGVIAIVTDVLWSTKASDWKKYKREMRFAQTP
jgi:hypothetical protein